MVKIQGHRAGTVVVLLVSVLVAAGCAFPGAEEPGAPTEGAVASEIVVDQDADGSEVALDLGAILVVALASNPSTGFSWELVMPVEPVLKQVGDAAYAGASSEEPAPPGSGGTEVFRFEAVEQGSIALELAYRRPWEEGVEPAEVFGLRIVVR